MKEQTFEEFLQERYSAKYGDGDETSDDFDQWIAELDPSKVMEYAERWGNELKHIYSFNVLGDLQNKEKHNYDIS